MPIDDVIGISSGTHILDDRWLSTVVDQLFRHVKKLGGSQLRSRLHADIAAR
jgi:hypothetical protein